MSRPGLTNERLVAAFLLGLLLFLPPLLGVFNTPRLVLGVPVLFLYCFAAWAAMIALVALIVSRSTDEDEPAGRGPAAGSADETGG